MRFMILVHATDESEAGQIPSTELLTRMGDYNEELVKAGIMLDGAGLHPTSRGIRIRFSGDQRTVIDGPFSETKELIAGYWIWEAASLEEAIEWVKRCPNPMEGESEIEIRQIFEAEDFGAEFTPEAREQDERAREEAAAARNDPALGSERPLQVVILHKTVPGAEEQVPSEKVITEMGNYMEALVRAGLFVSAEGLHPTRRGARVLFSGSRRTVIDGPFTEAKELIAGFTVIRVRSLDEAIAWVKKTPMPFDHETELEVRPIFGDADFGDALTPELIEQEQRLRAQTADRR